MTKTEFRIVSDVITIRTDQTETKIIVYITIIIMTNMKCDHLLYSADRPNTNYFTDFILLIHL